VGGVDEDPLAGQHEAPGGGAQGGEERQIARGDRLDLDAEREGGAVEHLFEARAVRELEVPAGQLEDAVERVGRAPLRKLSRKERFIGPAAELAEEGKPFDALLDAAEMAFRFQNVDGDEESVELAKIMKENKPEAVVEKVCGLTSKDKLYPHVVEIVKKVQADA